MTILRRILAAVAVAAWIVAPVVAAVALTARSERSVQSPPVASAWVPVGEVETELSRLVIATGTLGEAPPLVAPAWTGLVEHVAIAQGIALGDGAPVAVIDGVTRLAAHTPRPFRRPLTPADRGQDVADLNAWLAGRGYQASEGDRFGTDTRRGIRALRLDIGLDDDVDAFDPVWFVYLPRPTVTIRSVTLQVGVPAPAAGTGIAELDAQITEVTLLVPSATGVAGPSTAPPTASTLPDVPTGDGAPGTTAPPSTSSPPTGPGPTAPSGVPLRAAVEGATLERAGTTLGPVATDGTMPDETLFSLLPLLDGQESISVQLVEPEPDGVRAVPSAAVFTGPTGQTCVAHRSERRGPPTVALVAPRTQAGDRNLVSGLPDGPLEAQVNVPVAIRRLCQA